MQIPARSQNSAKLAILVGLWFVGRLALLPVAAKGAGAVELTVVADPRLPITAQQEWGQRLAAANVANFRIRTGRDGDRAVIDTRGTPAAPVYAVTALLTAQNEIVVPGARFTSAQTTQLAQWLRRLAEQGPPDARPQTAAFGLTAEQLEGLRQALALPVGFATKGLPRRDAVTRLAERLPLECPIGAAVLGTLSPDDLVREELSEVSRGTALAYLLRPAGWSLVPQAGAGGAKLIVVEAGSSAEIWPIGWPATQRRDQLLPGLYEFLTVNVQNVPVIQVIEAVGTRVGVPVLLDYNAMARHGIEPDKQLVSFPNRRTSYAILLRNCLFQAQLNYELRMDEAGKPLVWITTVKPM